MLAGLITKERQTGFSEAVILTSGSRRLHSYGSTANVPFFSSSLLTPLTLIFVAGSGKSILWFVIHATVACIYLHYHLARG